MLNRLADRLGLRTDVTIFFGAAITTIVFVLAAALFTETIDSAFGSAADWVVANLGWLFILGVTTFLVFLIWIAFSRYGHVRLGGPGARPEYGNASWFAMLFAAGIGTILMFFGVAEPINHYADPPRADVAAGPGSPEAASEAMGFTLYHYGLHTWAIFCLPALAFAYFVYKRGLPMRVSSVFHPMLGDKIHGPVGKTIDILAVIGTIFGVAVSIGLGTFQINSGLNELFGVPEATWVQVMIIAIITSIAVCSIVLGLDKGVKRLSNANILMAIGLLVFVFVTSASPLFLAKGTVETTGDYLSQLPPLALWNDAFGANPGWLDSNTVTIWAWTISWAPFVGIFVARISKGRTIRQFVGGVLGLPTAFTIIWFSVFGLSAIRMEDESPGKLFGPVVEENDNPGALFAFLSDYPLPTLVMALSVLIVVLFFTTSSDSASLVVDMLCTGEGGMGPTRQRVFWGVLEGAVGATLIVSASGAAGLQALSNTIVLIGVPFFAIGYLTMYCLVKSLRADTPVEELLPPAQRQHLKERTAERERAPESARELESEQG